MKASLTRRALYATISLALTWILALIYRESLVNSVKSQLTFSESSGILIKDKVATITDTLFTPRLIPLILHYRAVLGPSWPIVFFTSQHTFDKHFSHSASAAWRQAVADGSIETRIISSEFNLTSRKGVNSYFSNPWLWEQLAPAKHVLVFQADAILCANAQKAVDDYLEWDFIGAPLNDTRQVFNGGLSLRNRQMTLEIVNNRDWWEDMNTKGAEYQGHGEDYWMSVLMRERGAHLPSVQEALTFSKQLPWHFELPGYPIGYHRVHRQLRRDKKAIPRIREWCPEIDLAGTGKLR
ncbi:hypothetical protein FPOAC2_04383 [Fusarium poae]|uniref:hypothetical protein n=1 Tax=Fusarium poae TaxID=36050 RepID=UPI001CEA3801|nr:hypothetical protein FPOAC1_004301 [Fusarium poae]KAG8671064.1 hypothetical protein FPOAC1_004301 [Fusarium poae]